MRSRTIRIDEERCTGCGLCAEACHEGAISMVDGKARLVREDYCDGLGDCLPVCPADAITFTVDEPEQNDAVRMSAASTAGDEVTETETGPLRPQWPLQIRLLPQKASFYDDAELLIAADCTAFACKGFHDRFLPGHVCMIGCPKLDAMDYAEKLGAILRENGVRSLQVLIMEVPCCRGLEAAVARAISSSGKHLPVTITVISTDGQVI